jgi:hypothetical protein
MNQILKGIQGTRATFPSAHSCQLLEGRDLTMGETSAGSMLSLGFGQLHMRSQHNVIQITEEEELWSGKI